MAISVIALFGAILSAFGFGAANVVAKKALAGLSVINTLFIGVGAGTLLLFLVLLVQGTTENLIDLIPLAIGMAFLEVGLYLVLYKSFSVANLTVAVSILSTYPLFTFFVSAGFLGEELTLASIVFVIMTIVGATLTSIDWQGAFKDGFGKEDLAKGLPWILVTLGAHIIYFPLLSEFLNAGEMEPRLFLIKLFSLGFLGILFFIWSVRKGDMPKREQILPTSFLGILEAVGWIGLSIGFGYAASQVGTIIALTSIAPLFTALGAFIFLGERLRVLQYLGVLITLIGVIGLSV